MSIKQSKFKFKDHKGSEENITIVNIMIIASLKVAAPLSKDIHQLLTTRPFSTCRTLLQNHPW